MLNWFRNKNHPEHQYLDLLRELVALHDADPTPRADRTGTGTYGVFGRQIRFNLNDGFPLLTTKRVFTRGVIQELLWMLSGETNIEPLLDKGVHIWDEWADKDGNLGPVYGKQWRRWEGREGHIDQIADVITALRKNPNDRGHVVTAWNPADLPFMGLRPCHCLFQFYVKDEKLSCQLYQRSADIFLGVPFNIASYALLTEMIAWELNLGVGEFIHTFGDLHLYANHVEAAREQLGRKPKNQPGLYITRGPDNKQSIFQLTAENIHIIDYFPHPAIRAEVSV